MCSHWTRVGVSVGRNLRVCGASQASATRQVLHEMRHTIDHTNTEDTSSVNDVPNGLGMFLDDVHPD